MQSLSLSIKIAQKPYKIGSLGPKALKYESFEGKGVSKPKMASNPALGFSSFWAGRLRGSGRSVNGLGFRGLGLLL